VIVSPYGFQGKDHLFSDHTAFACPRRVVEENLQSFTALCSKAILSLLSLLVVSQKEISKLFVLHRQRTEKYNSLATHKSQQEIKNSSSGVVFRKVFKW